MFIELTMKRNQFIVCCICLFGFSMALQADALDEELGLSDALVSSNELDSNRGRADLDLVFQTNETAQNALMQNNTLHSEGTGNNSISSQAFSGMSGIATVIQNTGNQVIIQDTTMVNVLINQ